MPSHESEHPLLQMVEQGRRIRQDDPLDGRVRDVPLVPERDILEPRLCVRAEHTGEAGDLLGLDRVALVRHRARPLLAGGERLAHLGDLGAGEVAQLGREALEPGAGERDRGELGMPVARDHLGRDRLGTGAEPAEHAPLELGEVADTCRRLPTVPRRHLGEGALEPLCVAVRLEREAASLIPNVVGSAWIPWVRPTQGSAVLTGGRPNASTSARESGTTISPTRRSCSARPVSSTSLEVNP